MLREVYQELVRLAAASSRDPHEARDLVQAVLLEAMEHGSLDLTLPERRAWLRGAIWRRAAFEARTAGRRRRRETRWLDTRESANEASVSVACRSRPWRFSAEFLARLAPSIRVLAVLVSADLQPDEIRSVLRLTHPAYRKRLSALRHAVRAALADGSLLITRAPASFALGSARAEILTSLRRRHGWALASHDPDGHPLIFSLGRAHNPGSFGNSR